MADPLVRLYHSLLDEYLTIIPYQLWWDGRREDVVSRMDRVWERMGGEQKGAAVAYCHEAYRKNIGELE